MPQNLGIIVLIALAVLAVLFFGHYFLYYSLVNFFQITVGKTKMALSLLLFLFPASFILSSLVSHWFDSYFTKIFYFASGLWLAVAPTLLVAFLFVWVLIGIVKIFGLEINRSVIGIVAIVITFSYVGYGIWNAYHPRINNVTVKIKNLPASWQGKKAVQISDVHLGQILGEKFLKGVVEKINAEHPDIIFITGDLFDGMDGRLENLVEPLNNLFAPLGIYYVTGNHETYLGVSKAYQALAKTKVKILDDIMVNVEGMQIIGVSYPESGFSKDIKEVVKKQADFNPQIPSILLWHDPTQVKSAQEAGINLQLSGHTHKGQIFPVQFISRLIYKKYYVGLHQEGDYYINTSNGVGVWGPTVRTGNHPAIDVIHFE